MDKPVDFVFLISPLGFCAKKSAHILSKYETNYEHFLFRTEPLNQQF